MVEVAKGGGVGALCQKIVVEVVKWNFSLCFDELRSEEKSAAAENVCCD